MAHPFLSVITINRNNAAGLRGTIQSVLTQTGLAAGDLEYIIIDGASDDGSVDIIKEYAARSGLPHKVSYWVSEKDAGIYNAMNKGIRAAHGEYVAILNSGDSYVLDALCGIKEMAREHDGAILYGAVNMIYKGKLKEVWGENADVLPLKTIPHEAALIPMGVYQAYGLYDESLKICADYDLFCRLKEKGVPFFYTSKIITNFDDTGISSGMSKQHKAEDDIVRGRYGVAVKKTLAKRVRRMLKLFVPYGLMLLFWKVKIAREKKDNVVHR